jgi:acyl-CoA thioesterase FadM
VAPLQRLHESVVAEDEIDALGHMNVRHYGERALAATARLLERLGLALGRVGPGAGQGLVETGGEGAGYDLPRLYTRYQREQLAGAPLVVRGGVLDASPVGLRCYHELVNPARDEIAATFLHDVRLEAGEREGATVLSAERLEALAAERVALPEHGRPRSIDFDAAATAPPLEEAIRSGLALRRPRVIAPEDCDADGQVPASMRPFFMWGGETLDGSDPGPPVIPLAGGGRMGWASLEMRSVRLAPLRQGLRVQSFSAPLEVAKKTTLRRYWVFDLASGRPLLVNDVIDIALDLERRRAMEIPDDLRAMLERQHRPDLR